MIEGAIRQNVIESYGFPTAPKQTLEVSQRQRILHAHLSYATIASDLSICFLQLAYRVLPISMAISTPHPTTPPRGELCDLSLFAGNMIKLSCGLPR
jgi:hypothetical protein